VTTAPAPAEVRARVDAVWERIGAAGGDPERVRLVAVTKGFDAGVVRSALDAGLVDLGENYAQELVTKQAALDEDADGGQDDAGAGEERVPRWHFIGRLQSNKVRKIAPHVHLWQSVDRLSLASEIARRAPGAAVLAQVNLTGETTKGGCTPDGLPELLEGLAALGLEVRGLMTVGPLDAPEQARPAFRELRRLADAHGLPERSMGMSDDLEVAVEEGSTMVRVGSALFGPRPGPAGMGH
jgi:pyridoxal phosphate enzyme (YggS family)